MLIQELLRTFLIRLQCVIRDLSCKGPRMIVAWIMVEWLLYRSRACLMQVSTLLLSKHYDIALCIGDATVLAQHVLYAWYERWTGGFHHKPQVVTYCGPNPFGALLAGTFAATAVSRILLTLVADPASRPQPLPDSAALSAFSYSWPEYPEREPEIPSVIDLQKINSILLVGGGAVASGLVFALAALPSVQGTLDVVDDDSLDETNLERHLISLWEHIGVTKAQRIAHCLNMESHHSLVVHPHIGVYETLPAHIWRTVIAAVDKSAPRRHLQFDLPRVLLNAGTVGAEFLVSRHDYGAGPCAECLYPERAVPVRSPLELLAAQTGLTVAEVDDLYTTNNPLSEEQIDRIVQYGELVFPVEVVTQARQQGIRAVMHAVCTTAQVRPGLPVATIGFVAALPGLLLAAELVKEILLSNDPSEVFALREAHNVFRLDMFGNLELELEEVRPSRNCRCQSRIMQAAYYQRWS
jgi:molybdopterin/thiamine biosynthesis adenylyltransferase